MSYLEIGICANCKEPYKKRAGNQLRCGSLKYKSGCAWAWQLQRMRNYAKANRDKLNAYSKQYWALRPEKRRAREAKRRLKPSRKAYQTEYIRKWKAAHPDYFKKYMKAYNTKRLG